MFSVSKLRKSDASILSTSNKYIKPSLICAIYLYRKVTYKLDILIEI